MNIKWEKIGFIGSHIGSVLSATIPVNTSIANWLFNFFGDKQSLKGVKLVHHLEMQWAILSPIPRNKTRLADTYRQVSRYPPLVSDTDIFKDPSPLD